MQPQPAAAFSKFPDWVASVAFSPEGRTLAAGSYGVIKLFDPAEKHEVASLAESAGLVKALAFSADGGTLVSGSYQTVAIWDAASHKLLRQLKGHRGQVTAAAFSPDDKFLATASEDETVRFWDRATGEPRQTLSDLGQPALGLAFSRNGRWLAVCTGDATRPTKKGAARIYDLAGNLQFTLEGHDRVVSAVAFSPDDTQVATASADETIKLWNAETGKEVRTLEGHTRPVNSLAFFPGGRWLASASGGRNVGGNEVKLWDLSTGKERLTIDAHEGPVLQIALSADGRWLASAGFDKTVKLWDAAALVALAAGDKPNDKPPAEAPGAAEPAAAAAAKPLRLGIIGLDTSHSVAFTRILNAADAKEDISGCRVVAAYPKGSPDIESSTSRVPGYTKEVQALGVEIVDSIEALVAQVDAVLLETNDGRPHLAQVLPVLKAGKPVFIDKPIAGSLADAVAIFEAARKYKAPLFSSSSLRYTEGAQAIRAGKIGEVKGCDAYSPCALETTHPDLYWYGIHGVETLFTVMGTGCESVTRVSTPGIDLAVGVWQGGRVGTFRGVREDQGGGKAGYGGTAFGTKGVEQIGPYKDYRALVVEIIKFFRTGVVPVTEEETLEIYAFMEAADESKRQGGVPVKLETVLAKAREAAKARL
ncbi:MAG TPA: Gfo/Idh/MocA family oxidoreductase, partial [Planctomycetaceae bacterium]|nr:Gfo/Idh/MocA family oxidoreductase [Planctomycetaceae bacterium]